MITGKTILVGGATRGIGAELVKVLKKNKNIVIATSRGAPKKDLTELVDHVIDGVDFGEDSCIKNLNEGLKKCLDSKPLDIYCHIAGISTSWAKINVDDETIGNISHVMNVNTYGTMRAMKAVKPHLNKGAKVILMSSRMGSIADNTSGYHYAYRMSKAAMNMFGMSLNHELLHDDARKISTAIIHPGMVATELTGGHGISTSECVDGLVHRIEELNTKNSGRFIHAVSGEELPW